MGQRRRSGVSALVLGVGTLGVLLDSVSLGHAQTTGNTPTTAATDQGSTEEGKLEEIVVTAERRTEDVQKTAASLTVLSGHDLQDQGRYELSDILESVPGVAGGAATGLSGSVSSGTDTLAAGIVIRGIQTSGGTGGGITSVPSTAGYYVDDVYSGVGGDFDIQRVEVLRGPQGTLYGRSATSGVVAVHTVDPQLDSFNGFGTVELGDYELRHYTAAVNVPIGDTLAVRVSGNSYNREGYYSADGGAVRNQEGRVKLLWKPTDSLSVLVGFIADNNLANSGGLCENIVLTTPNSTYKCQNGPFGPGFNNYRQYWGNLVWDFGLATLTYIPAVRTWDSQLIYSARSPTLNFNQHVSTPEDNFITHELRFSSKPGSTLTWQAGTLYYDNNISNTDPIYAYPSGALNIATDVSRVTRAIGVFAEATYPVASAWRITGGLRYDRSEVDTNQSYTANANFGNFPEILSTLTLAGNTGDRTFANWTYKVRVEHDLAAANMIYAMVSTGSSPGDVTAANNANGVPIADYVKAETLTAYEVGSKNRFLNDTLQINADVFYEKYGGYQTAAISVTTPPVFSFPVITAGVRSVGAELEALYQLTVHDRLGLTYGLTNATYTDKDTPVPGATTTFGTFFAQDQVAGVVPDLVQANFDHTQNIGGNSKLTLHADARWLSPHYEGPVYATQLAPGAAFGNAWVKTQGEYVEDVSASWQLRKFSLTGYMRNIGNNRYKTNVIANPAFGQVTATPYNPRTMGIIGSVGW